MAAGSAGSPLSVVTEHLLTVRSPTEAYIASSVGMYGAEVIVATASEDMQLHLHRPFCKTHKVCCPSRWPDSGLWLTSWPSTHSEAVEQLSFSPCPPLQLASASQDRLLLWQLENCFPLPPGTSPPCLRLELPPPTSLGRMCFSPSAQQLVLCDGADIQVWEIQRECRLETALQGHSSLITHATFHPHHSHTLITTSQDRTFKVWDVVQSHIQYQSPIMSSVPLVCSAVDAVKEVLAIAAADGKLWLLDMNPGRGYRCLLECDVWRERDKFIHLSPSNTVEDGGGRAEAGAAILGLHYWNSSTEEEGDTSHISEAVLREPEALIVVGHSAIVVLDPNTLQATDSLDLRDPIPSSTCPPSSILPVATTSAMTTCLSDNQVYCLLNGMFEMAVSLLLLTFHTVPTTKGIGTNESVLSILSSGPLVAGSPLRSEFIPKPCSTARKKPGGVYVYLSEVIGYWLVCVPPTTGAGKGRSGGPIADQPLTFKTRIKSSGYTATPRMKMFTTSSRTAATTSAKSSKSDTHDGERRQQVYPIEGGPPTISFSTLHPLDKPSPLSSLTFTGDGNYCCGAAGQVAYLMKMPPSERRIKALVGHDGAVYSVDCSHSCQWMVSGSADRTARIWTPAQKDPLLTISAVQTSTKPTANQRSGPGKSPAGVSHAMFYYLDKFLLLSSSNSLYLYNYHIDPSPTDDIKRYRSLSRCKLVHSLAMDDMQTITAVATTNDFLSNLVLVGGSNRCVDILDVNVARIVRSMADCHTRPPHCIGLNKGSRGITHPGWAYDLFLTAAPVDGIKVWDLRTNRCVRCLSAHVNRCHTVSAEFSPCSRYIATGSEDRAAYLYDLRCLSPLHKLSGHSDTVLSLSFHPLKPMLATATLDGQLTFYTTDSR